ncbi:hypothetical protein [Tahibacter amnicola]|uniref:Leucine rich repeat (LRR) protein n=1 Tax=Tahibacter amnicola TaxID=2976241 RepID=A0ABY6B922_9GAMM|nr:hypothetical protein [Tahibacter amnicola]UXI66375.1 hypothetical protein N4264_16650 [Tahibacter amnicola]
MNARFRIPPALPDDAYYSVFGDPVIRCSRVAEPTAAIRAHQANPTATIGIEDESVADLRALQALPTSLQGLILGPTTKPKTHLDALAHFDQLDRLLISGKVKTVDPVGNLVTLRHLRFHRIRLHSLTFLDRLHHLETLVLDLCKLDEIGSLEGLGGLKQLVIHSEVAQPESLLALARLPGLERLSLCCDTPVHLPPMEHFPALRALRLTAPAISPGIEAIIEAPALEVLWMDVSDRRGDTAYRQWLRSLLAAAKGTARPPPPHLKRAWLGWMDGAERQALANWLQIAIVEQGGHLTMANAKMAVPGTHPVALPTHAPVEEADPHEAIQARVEKAIRGECLVRYAAYTESDTGEPIDNLDEIAWRGTCRFVSPPDTVHGLGSAYRSPPVTDPTWLDVARMANQMLKKTQDEDHCFLEGVTLLEHDGDVAILGFTMGS